jgi:phage I-like protein
MMHTVALLVAALALQVNAATHLLPAGEFKGRDGRPGKDLSWKLTDAQGRALAARMNTRHQGGVQFNLDYEHQAMLAEKNGQPAPASGWAGQFEWRDGQGLFALNVQWTAKAKQMIEAGEYKYISPVMLYNKDTGEVTDVINASLVNIPALDLNPVAQENMARLNSFFSTTNLESSMNPVLLACLAALGLPQTDATTAEQALSAIAALKAAQPVVPVALCKALALPDAATAAQAETALATLKADAAKVPALTTEVATLKAAQGNPDPTKWVALSSFTELSTQVAALSAAQVGNEVDTLIAAARAEGKCPPVVEQVWRDVGKKDIAQLKALIASTPGNPALAGLSQTAGKQVAAVVDPKAPLSADELAICNNMGLTAEQFRAGAMVAAA